MTTARDRIPIWLVTGWLGSGKTTLLVQWLQDPALADAAVIVNELGEVGLDHHLLSASTDSGVDPSLLPGGCVCCTGLPGLEQALTDLFWDRLHRRRPRFSSVVIETTGLADPRPVVEALQREPLLQERYRLAGVITMVAATSGPEMLQAHVEARAQVNAASLVVVTKTDLALPTSTESAIHAVRPAGMPLLSSARASLTWPDLASALAMHHDAKHHEAMPTERIAQDAGEGDHEYVEHAPHGEGNHAHSAHSAHTDHSHVRATFIPLHPRLSFEALQRELTRALQPPPWRLKGLAQLDDGRWFTVQWSPGDGAPSLTAFDGRPPGTGTSGLTRIEEAH